MKEQGSRDYEPMYKHLIACTYFHEICDVLSLGRIFDSGEATNNEQQIYNAVLNNCEVVHRYSRWSQLCYLEAYYIKLIDPKINCGIRASKELSLFK